MITYNTQIKQYLKQNIDLYGNELYFDSSEALSIHTHILDDYYKVLSNCEICNIEDKNNFLFASGSNNTRIMFIGESKAESENFKLNSFAGKSHKLFKKMLNAIDLNIEDIFLVNIFKCCESADLYESTEVNSCRTYLNKQIEILEPKLIVALGQVSACSLLEKRLDMVDLRDKLFQYNGVDFYVTYHPNDLLNNPKFKRSSWEDLKYIRKNYLND